MQQMTSNKNQKYNQPRIKPSKNDKNKQNNAPCLQIQDLDSNQSAYSQFNNYKANTSTNQNQSLLVSSSLRHDLSQLKQNNANNKNCLYSYNHNKTHDQKNCAVKIQGKFNNQKRQMITQLKANEKVQQQMNKSLYKKNDSNFQSGKKCIDCAQKINNLQKRVKQTQLKLQKMQSALNISYTKHIHQETLMSTQIKQFQTIKHFVWQINKKEVKSYEQYSVNQTQLKNQMGNIKKNLQKLQKRLKEKSNQITQLNQLQKKLFCQKLQETEYKNEKRMKQLVNMVEEISKIQNKMIIDRNNKQNMSNIQNLPNEERLSKGREKRNKISYYLSKSICNQSTIIGDSSINCISNLNL